MKKINSFRTRLVTMMMVFTFLFSYVSTPVFAAGVDVENHNPVSAGKTAVSGLTIDGVSSPVPGQRLDVSAVVHSKEGHVWEIAVIWLSSNGEVVTTARTGETYYPTLAFYLPPKYGMADGKFKLSVSDSVTKLMGSDELISVYDSKNGITYILSAVAAGKTTDAENTLVSGREDNAKRARDEFEALSTQQSEVSVSSDAHESSSSDDADDDDDDADDDDDDDDSEPAQELSVIDIYCAQSARDSMTTDDLESVIDLIINKLQPQAVELLKNSFPAFKSAEQNGELGSEMGLYIYYKKGDNDGKPEHEVPGMEELAYVSGDVVDVDGELKYGYIMAVNLESMVRKDKDDKPVIDKNGKYHIVFEGEAMDTMTYTIVHEMFHAFMDDYNRTGMAGGVKIEEVKTDKKGNLLTNELGDKFAHFHFPKWFIEGTASMTENDYEFRDETFDKLRTNSNTGKVNDYFDKDTLLNSYVKFVNKDGSETYFALPFAVGGVEIKGKEVEADTSRYVSGYLASIYLSELAYRTIHDTGAEKEINAKSSARYREGLNWILESLHNGNSLDSIIKRISPVDENGKKLYKDTEDFGEKFIEGAAVKKNNQETYYGDPESMNFTLAYLNYLREVDHDKSRKNGANGSILFDLDVDMSSPLDRNKEATSDSFKIAKTKDLVVSSVKPDTIDIGAGKSSLGDWEKQKKSKDKPALAAKTKKTEVKAAAKTRGQAVVNSSADTEKPEVKARTTEEIKAVSTKETQLKVTSEKKEAATVTEESSSKKEKETTAKASVSETQIKEKPSQKDRTVASSATIKEDIADADMSKEDNAEADTAKECATNEDIAEADKTESDEVEEEKAEAEIAVADAADTADTDKAEEEVVKADKTETETTKTVVAEPDAAEEEKTEAEIAVADAADTDKAEEAIVRADKTEAETTKADIAESDAAGQDNVEAGIVEPDATVAEKAEEDLAEEDVAKEDTTEKGKAEEDAAEADESEANTAETDATEEDNAEADIAKSGAMTADTAEAADAAEEETAEENEALAEATQEDSIKEDNTQSDSKDEKEDSKSAGEDVTKEAAEN